LVIIRSWWLEIPKGFLDGAARGLADASTAKCPVLVSTVGNV